MSKDVAISVLKELNFTGNILSISFLDKCIVMIDNFFNLYLINSDNFGLIRSIHISQSKDGMHKYSKAISSSRGGFIAFPSENLDSELTFLLTDDIVESLKHLSWHISSIEVSKFSSNSKFLATGGQDGKTFIYDVPSLELITSLPNRPDFISSISFSKDCKKIAVSSFDKITTVFDLNRMIFFKEIETKDVVEASVFFENDSKIFMVTQNGAGEIFDFEENKVISKLNHFNSWPTSIDMTEDGKFAIVGTRGSYVYIIRLKDNQKLLEVDLESGGITMVKIYKNTILIAFTSGNLKVLDFDKHLDELQNAINKKDYAFVKEILDKNVFLRIHPYYDEFNKAWPSILQKAVELLTADRIKDALEIVQPFVSDDERKQEEFNVYLMKKDLIKEFMQIINKEDYKHAYSIADDNQYLKHTKAYDDLEKKWLSIFDRARKLLEEDMNMNKNMAKSLLAPFTNIDEKKNLISNLLKNAGIFRNAEDSIKRRDFKGYFGLVKKHSFLKETGLYKKVVHLGDNLLEQMIILENAENFVEAKKVADTLVNFATHFIATKEKLALIKDKETLIALIQNKKYHDACNLVFENPTLSTTSYFKRLENKFSALFEDARKDAFNGDVQSVIATVGPYFKIGYWQDKVANIVKIGYITQIKNIHPTEHIDWDATIKNYLIRFGIDSEIERLALNLDNMDIVEKYAKQANTYGYKKHNFIEDVVVRK